MMFASPFSRLLATLVVVAEGSPSNPKRRRSNRKLNRGPDPRMPTANIRRRMSRRRSQSLPRPNVTLTVHTSLQPEEFCVNHWSIPVRREDRLEHGKDGVALFSGSAGQSLRTGRITALQQCLNDYVADTEWSDHKIKTCVPTTMTTRHMPLLCTCACPSVWQNRWEIT